MVKVKVIWLLWCPDNKNLLRPADGALARDDVTFAVIEAEVGLNLAHALTRQTVHTQVSGVAHTLRLARPPVDHAPGELVTGLELTGVGPVTCPQNHRTTAEEEVDDSDKDQTRRRVHSTELLRVSVCLGNSIHELKYSSEVFSSHFLLLSESFSDSNLKDFYTQNILNFWLV